MFFAIHEGRKYIEHVLADAGCKRCNIDENISDMMVNLPDVEDVEGRASKTYVGTKVFLTGVGDGMI